MSVGVRNIIDTYPSYSDFCTQKPLEHINNDTLSFEQLQLTFLLSVWMFKENLPSLKM
jgi:hypothetical protein